MGCHRTSPRRIPVHRAQSPPFRRGGRGYGSTVAKAAAILRISKPQNPRRPNSSPPPPTKPQSASSPNLAGTAHSFPRGARRPPAAGGMPPGKSGKGALAAAPGSGGDRIGALPDEILHRVLSFLPAQQAVRTCVLARRWLHLWKHATGLRIVGADGKAPVPFEEVRRFVDSLLILRGSSPLETFELKVAGAAVDVRHLRLWVRYGMMCNVQELRLNVIGNAPASLRPEDPALASKHLTRLALSSLAFNNDFLDFSRCPALQYLGIEDCSFIHVERISSQSLCHLNITDGLFNHSYRTRIHAPNLAILELVVNGGRTPILERMPLLVAAVVVIWGNGDWCNRSNNGDCGDESCKGCILDDTSSVLLHGLSQAKTLELSARTELFIFRRDLKWCPTFSQLKALVLTEHNVHALACILGHSPVLESLKLYLIELDKVSVSGERNSWRRIFYHLIH